MQWLGRVEEGLGPRRLGQGHFKGALVWNIVANNEQLNNTVFIGFNRGIQLCFGVDARVAAPQDDVPWRQALGLSRAYKHPLGGIRASQTSCWLFGLGDDDAQVPLLYITGFQQLSDDRLDHRQWNRQADAIESASTVDAFVSGRDGRVHPDHTATSISEWPAAIAGVDSGIYLDEVFIARPSKRPNDACKAAQP